MIAWFWAAGLNVFILAPLFDSCLSLPHPFTISSFLTKIKLLTIRRVHTSGTRQCLGSRRCRCRKGRPHHEFWNKRGCVIHLFNTVLVLITYWLSIVCNLRVICGVSRDTWATTSTVIRHDSPETTIWVLVPEEEILVMNVGAYQCNIKSRHKLETKLTHKQSLSGSLQTDYVYSPFMFLRIELTVSFECRVRFCKKDSFIICTHHCVTNFMPKGIVADEWIMLIQAFERSMFR